MTLRSQDDPERKPWEFTLEQHYAWVRELDRQAVLSSQFQQQLAFAIEEGLLPEALLPKLKQYLEKASRGTSPTP